MNKPSTPTNPNAAMPSDGWPGKQLDASRHKGLHIAIWALIYGGVLVACAGFATGDKSMAWGWSLGAVGASATAVGFVLIYIRSRFPRT